MCKEQTCTQCLLDTTDSTISFDEKGVCNYCVTWRDHKEWFGYVEKPLEVWQKQKLPPIIQSGLGKKYNAIVGVSGGIDSSYLCYRLKAYKELKPLLVHVSGVFDTDVSKRNLQRIVENTGYDIVYPTVDLADYLSVQKAYLKASVLDADVPADYLIEAYIRLIAKKYGIKFVLSGGNYMADAFMPYTWTFRYKLDLKNLLDINRKFGDFRNKLESFPKFGLFDELWSRRVYKLQYETPLNYFNYSRFTALEELQKAWNYEAYGDKHDENIYTRFYQKYILPYKFNIDKRKANYSNYIRAGVWTKDHALREIAKPFYNGEQYASDRKNILSVLGWSNEYFDSVLALPPRKHEEFATSDWIYDFENFVVKCVHRLGL
jgi:hypothetical protein